MVVQTHTDLVVEANDGSYIAEIEINNQMGLTIEAATDTRRRFIEYDAVVWAPYFMDVSQDHGYLWRLRDQPAHDAPPGYCWPMDEVVPHYMPDVRQGERIYGSVFEWLVVQWINDLSVSGATQPDRVRSPLEESGFLDAVRGGLAFFRLDR